MGTREADQPVEQWAGPGSLDPTPVWKQYILVALLLFVGLAVVIAVSVTALAPSFVTPPALVIGDRLVLSASDVPTNPSSPRFFGAPLVDDGRSFYLVQPAKGRILALRAHWRASPTSADCLVQLVGRLFVPCDAGDGVHGAGFSMYGDPAGQCGTLLCPTRGLDQYLVSVSGDRVIVNLSRVIEASEPIRGPVPTGIPQPQTQQP